jgi:hypothetical protein
LLIVSADAIVVEKAWLGGKASNNHSIDRLVPVVASNNRPLVRFSPDNI